MGECVLEVDFVEAALGEDGLSVRLRRTLLKLHLWKIGECVLEADFVETILVVDGESVRLGRTLFKLHWLKVE